ncbi:MAG: hypothetical protein MUD01_19645 [Chloroflexaceae bacterium]|jgi:hypothetical protein|nr:hypothetical protein [Chloroflexaceae bacterium]
MPLYFDIPSPVGKLQVSISRRGLGLRMHGKRGSVDVGPHHRHIDAQIAPGVRYSSYGHGHHRHHHGRRKRGWFRWLKKALD